MAEVAIATSNEDPPPRRLRHDWARRLLNELFALFVALLIMLVGLLILLDSAPGHRFIIDQIGKLETASGLRIRIGRIDGSIFGKSQLRDVTVSDSRGVFLASPNIKLDWSPGAWLNNKLYVDSLTAERVALIRIPKLKPSTKKGPILPGFDIHIGDLRVDRLEIGPQVGGQPRSGRLRGKADVRSGRALVELAAVLNNGGDRIAFHLDAEPLNLLNGFGELKHVFEVDGTGGRTAAIARVLAGQIDLDAQIEQAVARFRHVRERQLDSLARHGGARPLRTADSPPRAGRR